MPDLSPGFLRRCPEHRLPLAGLDCPKGHVPTAEIIVKNEVVTVTTWEVWSTKYSRRAFLVVGRDVEIAEWFRDAVDFQTLAGRDDFGMSGSLLARLRRAGR